MNEKQKEEMGKRLVEILKEMNIIKKDFHGQYHDQIFIIPVSTEKELIQHLTEAIRIYEGECLKKAWEKHKKESGT